MTRPAKRRKAAPKAPVKQQEVVNVFPADKTAEILARGAATGPGARLRIRDDGKKAWASFLPAEGTVATSDHGSGEINNAHRCPPNTDC